MLPEADAATIRAQADAIAANGVPEATALRFARVPRAVAALDIVVVSSTCGVTLEEAGQVWFALNRRFRIGDLDHIARGLSAEDYYDGLALDRARRSLADAHRALAVDVLTETGRGNGADRVDAWLDKRGGATRRTQNAVDDIVGSSRATISRLAVAAGLLSDLAAGERVAA